jgi:RNA polymerase sigma-70 factor, ECF subfamily
MNAHNLEQELSTRSDWLYNAAMKLTRDTELSKDLVQDTFYKALQCKKQFVPGTNLNGWLYTILRNTYINSCRRNRSRSHIYKNILPQMQQGLTEKNTATFKMFRSVLEKEITVLPNRLKHALQLRIEGYQYGEIASITGESLGTIKSRIYLAKSRLKQRLKKVLVSEGYNITMAA